MDEVGELRAEKGILVEQKSNNGENERAKNQLHELREPL